MYDRQGYDGIFFPPKTSCLMNERLDLESYNGMPSLFLRSKDVLYLRRPWILLTV